MTWLEEHIAHVSLRALQDAWSEGTAIFWERRARQLEAARPRRDDYPGQAAPADLTSRWDRLTAAAEACRARASFVDATREEFEATLRDLAAGAAA